MVLNNAGQLHMQHHCKVSQEATPPWEDPYPAEPEGSWRWLHHHPGEGFAFSCKHRPTTSCSILQLQTSKQQGKDKDLCQGRWARSESLCKESLSLSTFAGASVLLCSQLTQSLASGLHCLHVLPEITSSRAPQTPQGKTLLCRFPGQNCSCGDGGIRQTSGWTCQCGTATRT